MIQQVKDQPTSGHFLMTWVVLGVPFASTMRFVGDQLQRYDEGDDEYIIHSEDDYVFDEYECDYYVVMNKERL